MQSINRLMLLGLFDGLIANRYINNLFSNQSMSRSDATTTCTFPYLIIDLLDIGVYYSSTTQFSERLTSTCILGSVASSATYSTKPSTPANAPAP